MSNYISSTSSVESPIWPGRVLPPSWGGQYLFYLCDECPGASGIHVEEQVIRWARLSSKLVDWILTNFDSAWLWTACESLESQPLKGKDGMCTVYYLVSLHADFVWAHELTKSQWNLFLLPHVFFLNQILWPLMPTTQFIKILQNFSIGEAVFSSLRYINADMGTQLETLTHEASHHENLGKLASFPVTRLLELQTWQPQMFF